MSELIAMKIISSTIDQHKDGRKHWQACHVTYQRLSAVITRRHTLHENTNVLAPVI